MPLKQISTPRAELQAAVLAAKMATLIREETTIQAEEYFWSDANVVLAYINNDVRRFHVFVANRIQKIRSQSEVENWRYIPSEQNPADHASRGLLVKDLLSSDWFQGPSFLYKEDITTECYQELSTELSPIDPEVRHITNKVPARKTSFLKDYRNFLAGHQWLQH
jgi:hypothetical protein